MNNELNSLTDLVKSLNFKGHSPATSGNYSYYDRIQNKIFISESSKDKEFFDKKCWLEMDLEGNLIDGFTNRKSSAETDLHLAIYQNTDAGCVLHSHHLSFLGLARAGQVEILFQGQEIQKAINGFTSHESVLALPVFENTQDILTLSKSLFNNSNCKKAFAFLIRNHGLTVWGKTVSEAKRHLEAYTYLFTHEKNTSGV